VEDRAIDRARVQIANRASSSAQGQREAPVTTARRCAESSELPAQVNLFAHLEAGQAIDGEGRDLRQVRDYASCNLSPSRSANSRFLKTLRLAVAADDCRTASGKEQGGGPSLTAARSANLLRLDRKSSGDWTTGRALVRNTHRGFFWLVRQRCI